MSETSSGTRIAWIIIAVLLVATVGGYFIVGPAKIREMFSTLNPPPIPAFELSEVEPRVASVISEARRRVEANPRSAQAWGKLGQVCDIHSFLEEAKVCYAFAMEAAPDDGRWPYLLAFVYDQSDAPPTESIALYNRALESIADYWPAMVRRGDAHMRNNDAAAAYRDYARAAELKPDDAAVLRRLGQAQTELGQIEAAIQSLEQAASLAANDQSTLSALSRAYAAAGNQLRADEASRNAAQARASADLADPIREEVVAMGVSSTLAIMRADQYMRHGAFDRARDDLLIALETRPNDVAVHSRLGRVYAVLGNANEAVRHLKRAVDIDPTHAASYVRLGSIYNDLGNAPLAEQAFTKAVELEPDNAASHALLGIALIRLNKPDKAIPHFERSAALATPNDLVEFNWGNAYMQLNDPANAEPHYARSISMNSNNPDALFNYGLALEYLGRLNEAQLAYQAALRIDPNHRAKEQLLKLGGGGP